MYIVAASESDEGLVLKGLTGIEEGTKRGRISLSPFPLSLVLKVPTFKIHNIGTVPSLKIHNVGIVPTLTRPSSDSEAATMYKLKGQSSNMRTGPSS